MQFPSSVLGIFRFHDGVQNPADGTLDVPRILTPTIEIPEPLRHHQIDTAATVPCRTSTGYSFNRTVANAAAAEGEVAILGAGLWDVVITALYFSNNTNLAEGGEIYIDQGVTNFATVIFKTKSIANLPQFFSQRYRFAIDNATIGDTGISIFSQLDANGAGDSHSMQVSVVANRLG